MVAEGKICFEWYTIVTFIFLYAFRLIHYNAKTKENKVLIENIHFANGVAFSADEEFIIVSETARSRLLRYYLKGPKAGTSEVFIDGLPGLPDNLKSDGQGGFLVPLVLSRNKDHPILFQSLGPFPRIRKLISRVMGLGELAFTLLNQLYPNEFCQRSVHMVRVVFNCEDYCFTTFAFFRLDISHL